jgi:pheromone shutdown protein TraB
MTHNGVFRSARTDDPNIIAIEVDTARAQKIFANDDSIKQFIAKRIAAPASRAVAPKRIAAG